MTHKFTSCGILTVFFTLLQNLPYALGSVLLVVAFNITSGSSHNIDMKNYLKGSFDDTIIFYFNHVTQPCEE